MRDPVLEDPLENLFLYDTTLRDGAQTRGVTFSLEDKLVISKRLSEYGFHCIESGWPSSNPRDTKFFSEAKNLRFNSKIAAFGMTSPTPKKDKKIEDLMNTEADVLTIFGKSWDMHVKDILKLSSKENLRMISETVNYLKSHGFTVFCNAKLFLMLAKKFGKRKEPFELLEYETKVSSIGNTKTEIKVRVESEILHEIAEGVGPVHSLDMTLRKALKKFYAMNKVHLSNFRVRIINQDKATVAKVEVFIEFRANGDSWSTSDVSNDIIKVSKDALITGYKYYLLKINVSANLQMPLVSGGEGYERN